MPAALLAFGAALGWGTTDFLGGLRSRSQGLLAVLAVTQSTALVLLGGAVIALGGTAPEGRFLLFAAVAGLAEGLGVAALYRGLAVGTMSVVAPVASVAPAVPLVAGLVIGEVPTPLQFAGLVVAIVGVLLTSCQERLPRQAERKLASSVLYGLVSAVGFGVFFVTLDAASDASIPWALFVARLSAVAAIGVVMIIGRRRVTTGRAELPLLLAIGVMVAASDAMYATATTLGLLGIVAVIGALHTVVTIALAHVFLRERLARWQRAGIAACIAGVLVITGGSH